jgi:hypothetical protein
MSAEERVRSAHPASWPARPAITTPPPTSARSPAASTADPAFTGLRFQVDRIPRFALPFACEQRGRPGCRHRARRLRIRPEGSVPADAAGRSLSTASGVRPGRVGGDRNATVAIVCSPSTTSLLALRFDYDRRRQAGGSGTTSPLCTKRAIHLTQGEHDHVGIRARAGELLSRPLARAARRLVVGSLRPRFGCPPQPAT